MIKQIATTQTKGTKGRPKVYQIWTDTDADPPRYDWQCDNCKPRFLRFLHLADVVRDAELVLERN